VVEPSKDNNIVWTAGSKGFGKVNLKTREIIVHSRSIGYEDRSLAILESISNRIWLGSVDGLFEFRDSMLISQNGHAAFQDRVEALGELSDSSLVIGIKGRGVYFWNPNETEPYLSLDKTNGLTSNLVENIFVDDEENVWVGTPFGLNKISINTDSSAELSNFEIKHFTTNHGLPSNEINMVRKFNDKLWVATSRGLINLIEQPESKISPQPIIQDIYLNGKRYSPEESIEIHFGNNNLAIEYVTLNYGLGRDNIPYRFQLLPSQSSDWTLTKNRTINFSSLTNGQYTFNVQSQNEDGYWSDSTQYDFVVLAPFWKRWWFILLSILGLIGLFILVYKYRVRQVRHEANIQKKMNELERSALRSQMNPHFIFNALNAIQNYINIGDKLSANRYLSRFARLIRTALNHSRVTKIALEDEISTLENYLELEQMRFSGEFEYEISVADDIEPFAVEIPSMLIQPFIENSIVHGLSTKEGKGKISIDFRKSDNKLFVTIEDNGIGINQSLKQKKSSLHKSVGMTITKQRLEILNGKKSMPYLQIKELKNEEGKVAGTSVKLEINI
jgi:signal transduction histidine kinase